MDICFAFGLKLLDVLNETKQLSVDMEFQMPQQHTLKMQKKIFLEVQSFGSSKRTGIHNKWVMVFQHKSRQLQQHKKEIKNFGVSLKSPKVISAINQEMKDIGDCFIYFFIHILFLENFNSMNACLKKENFSNRFSQIKNKWLLCFKFFLMKYVFNHILISFQKWKKIFYTCCVSKL